MRNLEEIEAEIKDLRDFTLSKPNTAASERAEDYIYALLWVLNRKTDEGQYHYLQSPLEDVQSLSN